MDIEIDRTLDKIASEPSKVAQEEIKGNFINSHKDSIKLITEEKLPLPDQWIYITIWLIDCGDIELTIPAMRLCYKHDLSMPDGFKRSMSEFFIEEVARLALDGKHFGDEDFLQQFLVMIKDLGCACCDPVTVKLYRAVAKLYKKDNGKQYKKYMNKAIDYSSGSRRNSLIKEVANYENAH